MKILVSACLLGENCKYNGKNNYSERVAKYLEGHEVIPVCPEVLGGLPTPRDPSEIVRVAAEKIGVDVTAVNRRDYGQKIGTLAEISGFHKNGKIYNGPDFAIEMLVFSGMDSQQVDAFLAEYKATGLPPVALKAIVTPYNVSWTADALLRELMKEHIQLGG